MQQIRCTRRKQEVVVIGVIFMNGLQILSKNMTRTIKEFEFAHMLM